MNALDIRLLQALREARVHLPAGDLAIQLGSSAATVHSAVNELRSAGFEIDERPTLGLRLLKSPDRLIAADIAARFNLARPAGRPSSLVSEVVVFEETGSTNELAIQRGRDGAESGLVIFAERQSAGRGRFGRRWESASHRGLWFSLLLRPELPMAQWPRLTTWAAAGVAGAIDATTSCHAAIKWPNDVFLDGRKIAGILIESGVDAKGGLFAVVGIGINVNHEAGDFPPELAGRASSLRQATGRPHDRAELAARTLLELDVRFALLRDAFAELVGEASRRSLLLGRWVQFSSGAHLHEGLAEGLDDDGQLRVRAPDGTLASLIAGEVTVVGSRAIS